MEKENKTEYKKIINTAEYKKFVNTAEYKKFVTSDGLKSILSKMKKLEEDKEVDNGSMLIDISSENEDRHRETIKQDGLDFSQ
jgi:hypothetical protein